MLELNKQRGRREIDAGEYSERSYEVMEALDGLFAKRDELTEAQSAGALSATRRKMISDILENEQTQTGFDKDVFSKLVESIRVYGRDEITFIFRDGTEVKAETGAAE